MDTNLTCCKCEKSLPIGEFNLNANKKHRNTCFSCRKISILERSKLSRRRLRKENPEKYRQKSTSYRERNPEKFKASKKAWKEKNKEKVKQYNKEYSRRKDGYFFSPARKLTEKVRRSFLTLKRFSSGKKVNSKSSFSYVGCESVEQFLSILSSKTSNQNWLQDGYEIDHIWQQHWFKEYIENNLNEQEKIDSLLRIINHHSNLRPLPADENLKRSWYDFSPLKLEDFKKFEPFLNQGIKKKIQEYFGLN